MLTTGALLTTIIGWVIFVGVLAILFSRVGKGGKWED
jgi:hypothetical protein